MDQRKPERDLEVFGERVHAALGQENKGTRHHRIGIIADHAFEAHVEAALRTQIICDFNNKNGCCKLPVGHDDKHVVVDFASEEDTKEEGEV